MDKLNIYNEEIASFAPEDRIFIDETGSVMNLATIYGRAPSHERVHDYKPVNRGKRINTIGAVSESGLLSAISIDGTFNGYIFSWFVEHFLVPHLSKHKVVIMDNAKIHMEIEALELIEQTGAKITFLPPYAPEINPIEHCCSVLKNHLRKAKARTVDALYKAIEQGIKLITPQLTKACCQHCQSYT